MMEEGKIDFAIVEGFFDKEKYDSMTDFELVDELSKIANVKVPQAIEDIRSAEVLHKTECDVEDMPKTVKAFLNI